MNVQQIIIKGIKEQLFFHNYLVLPNFGGFVLKSNPSHFSNTNSVLIPPSKTLSFNSQLKQNDGILATWLQNELKYTSSEALSDLNEFSDYCKSILTTRRRLSIDGVGFFYLDFESNTCFEPQLDTNFLADSFGLKPLSLIELSETGITDLKKEVITEDRVGNDIINTQPELKKQKNYRRVITPLALTVAIFSLLALIVTNSKITGKLKSAIYGSNETGTYSFLNYQPLNLSTTTTPANEYIADANGVGTIEVDNNKTIAVRVIENTNSAGFTKNALDNTSHKLLKHNHTNFEVVLGCFSVFENAQRMMSKLKRQNINAVISEQNAKGMYVVSNGDFQTKEQAISKLEEISSLCPNAWVKKPE